MKKPKNTSKKRSNPRIRAARQMLHTHRGEVGKITRKNKGAPHRSNGARITLIFKAGKSAPAATTPKRRRAGAKSRLKRQSLHMLHIPIIKKINLIFIYIGGYIERGVVPRGAKKRGGER